MPDTLSPQDYDIFSGTPERDALWVETIGGLNAARERLKQLATSLPGAYFTFDARRSAVVERIDTTRAEP